MPARKKNIIWELLRGRAHYQAICPDRDIFIAYSRINTYFYNVRCFVFNYFYPSGGFWRRWEFEGEAPFLPLAATQKAARRSLTGIGSKAKGALPPQKSVMSPEPNGIDALRKITTTQL